MEHFPLISVEDDGRLNDPLIRENFMLQIFAVKRWRDNLTRKRAMGNLVDFHTRNKLLILSRSKIRNPKSKIDAQFFINAKSCLKAKIYDNRYRRVLNLF
jgi:uncharacterized protein YbgA (DUF1722 family)